MMVINHRHHYHDSGWWEEVQTARHGPGVYGYLQILLSLLLKDAHGFKMVNINIKVHKEIY